MVLAMRKHSHGEESKVPGITEAWKILSLGLTILILFNIDVKNILFEVYY